MNLSVINADYYPTIPREEIVKKCSQRLPIKELQNLGGGFAVVAAEIAKQVINNKNAEGLYRCVFPQGVTGELAKFKDGSGMLGTIMKDGNFVGQARWIPAEGKSIAMTIDPVTLAISVVIMSINKKLNAILEAQADILNFLQQDKESELEGAINSLSDILGNYRYNNDNEVWMSSQLTVSSVIKGKAEHSIIFYRKEIANALQKQESLHSDQKANKLKEKLQHDFKYYQLGVYMYAYSSFLEVILTGNLEKTFLEHIKEKIDEYSYQYRLDYSQCYEKLEMYSKNSIQNKVLGGIGNISKLAGEKIANIPVISKGPVDEALIEAGEKVNQFTQKQTDKIMTEFQNNRDAGIRIFCENIDLLNATSNKPLELLFDKDEIYICA